MNLNLTRVVFILAVVGIGLVFLNFFLVSKFNPSQEQLVRRNSSKGLLSLFFGTIMDFSHLDIGPFAEYKIQSYFIRGTAKSYQGPHNVVLVTHCTANHLHYLLDLIDHWKGPISVAIVVPGLEIISAYRSILGLHQCSKEVKRRVTFHIIYPLSHPALDNQLINYVKQARNAMPLTCEEFLVSLQTGVSVQRNYADKEIPYPNNLLRNVAWTYSDAEYIFMVDIDMMCNVNLYSDFVQFAKNHKLFGKTKDKRVFVVPAFESQENVPPNTSKSELIKLWNTGKVQPFYYEACWKCQRPTNYDKWKKHTSSIKGIKISHLVDWKDPWEPFYIGPRIVPLYDDRFKQYGFNRISQVCETHIAGYNFTVLDKAFLVHHGFKKKFHKKKDEENARNRELFRTFKKELKDKYPKSGRRC